jgi:hypothetical protein
MSELKSLGGISLFYGCLKLAGDCRLAQPLERLLCRKQTLTREFWASEIDPFRTLSYGKCYLLELGGILRFRMNRKHNSPPHLALTRYDKLRIRSNTGKHLSA